MSLGTLALITAGTLVLCVVVAVGIVASGPIVAGWLDRHRVDIYDKLNEIERKLYNIGYGSEKK